MRYWLHGSDGNTYGPFTIEQLRAFGSERRLIGETLLCAEGGTEWVAASTILGSTLSPPTVQVHAPGSNWEPAGYVLPVVVTLFCCLIGGIVSIVFAAQANSKAAGGNLEGAARDKKTSIVLMWVSVGIGLAISALWIVAAIFLH